MHPPTEGWKKLTLTILGTVLVTLIMLVGPKVGIPEDICKFVSTAIGTLFGVSIAAFGLQDIGKAKAKIENSK